RLDGLRQRRSRGLDTRVEGATRPFRPHDRNCVLQAISEPVDCARKDVGRLSAELACRVLPTNGRNDHASGGTAMTQTLPPRSNRPDAASRAESSAAVSPVTRLVPVTSIRTIEADGIRVFYREAGPPDGAVVLLLHGFPASSFMFRDLIPRLADRYRVIAPDLPGFGFTEVPPTRNYVYSFDALARTITAFTEALHVTRCVLYVFDYG